MSAKHTQGPWLALRRGMAVDAPGLNPSGPHASADGREVVCFTTGYFGFEQQDANGHLIAAAPELLEALLVIVQDDAIEYAAGGMYTIAVNGRDLIQARAAIAKATGSAA